MNPKVIVPLFFISAVFHSCPSETCMKKIRTLIRNKVKEEKPAELYRDETSFIKYSHATSNNFYIEIAQDENKSLVVKELDEPPIAMNQVTEDDLLNETSTMTTEEEQNLTPSTSTLPVTVTTTTTTELTTTTASPTSPPPPHTTEKVMPTTQKSGNGNEEEEEEITLSPEDQSVRDEWGGQCTLKEWNRCNKIRKMVVLDVIHNPFERKDLQLDCLLEPILCLRNGWTANRCHILCMAAQCNKDIFYDWDGTVDFEGPCRYRK